MKPKTIPLLLLALPTLSTPSPTCNNYVIISVRGTYEPQGRSIAFTTMINQTFAALPGGTEYDAVYPAAAEQTAYLGANDITAYLQNGLQNCPKQQYAILGYSQGATATMLTLNDITDPSTAMYKAIKAVLVVGNPYHIPNAAANIDENDGDSTKKYPGSVYDAKNANGRGIPQIYYDSGTVLDICHTEDKVCAPGYPGASFAPGHLHYGENNTQELGAKFLIKKLGGEEGGASSTASATGTATATGTGSSGSPSSAQPTEHKGAAGRVSVSFVAALGGILALLL